MKCLTIVGDPTSAQVMSNVSAHLYWVKESDNFVTSAIRNCSIHYLNTTIDVLATTIINHSPRPTTNREDQTTQRWSSSSPVWSSSLLGDGGWDLEDDTTLL